MREQGDHKVKFSFCGVLEVEAKLTLKELRNCGGNHQPEAGDNSSVNGFRAASRRGETKGQKGRGKQWSQNAIDIFFWVLDQMNYAVELVNGI